MHTTGIYIYARMQFELDKFESQGLSIEGRNGVHVNSVNYIHVFLTCVFSSRLSPCHLRHEEET